MRKLYDEEVSRLVNEKTTSNPTEKDNESIFENEDIIELEKCLIDKKAKEITNYFRKTMDEEVSQERVRDLLFITNHEKQWGSAFVASEAMYIMTVEAAEAYIEYVNKLDQQILEEKHYTFTALMHLHGRALQQFLEIITLMKNGFADGAYARWRSMYELAIISSFISEHGESVAKEFINSHNTEDRYQWALKSNLFNKKRRVTFSDIEKKCRIDAQVWKEQYTLANRVIHASPQATFSRLSNTGTEDRIPVGRSNFGHPTPAEHSAISLAQITSNFLTVHTSKDALQSVVYVTYWIDVIREEYFKTHDLLFPDQERLWEDNFVSYRK